MSKVVKKIRYAHLAGGTDIAYTADGKYVVSCGADCHVRVHETDAEQSGGANSSRQHSDEVLGLAISPNGAYIASASRDASVRIYSYPDLEELGAVERFSDSVCALSFGPSSTFLAAAGVEDCVKIISVGERKIMRTLKGKDGCESGFYDVAVDPLGEYVAAMSKEGYLVIWDIESGEMRVAKQLAAFDDNPDDLTFMEEMDIRSRICWKPDGSLLAVPGVLDGGVSLLNRTSFRESFKLNGGHQRRVLQISFSPNGRYAVTSGLDRQVLLWDIDNREDMRRSRHDTVICGLGWHPDGSSIAIADVDGHFGIWPNPIPSHMSKASIATGEEKAEELKDRQKLMKFENTSSASEDEDGDEDLSLEGGVGKFGAKKRRRRRTEFVNAVLPQESFQPGATPKEPGNKRRFLAYTSLGYISSRDDDSYFSIDVEFHDSISFGRKVQTLTDYYEYTMAALSSKGAVFACPNRGEEQPSVLFFKPFEAWASKSEWTLNMAGAEEVRCVAVGDEFVAAGTSLNVVRIFSYTGIQRSVLALPGPPVTMASHGNHLAIVYHSGDPIQSTAAQQISFMLLDISRHALLDKGFVATSPGSHLNWLGFCPSGSLLCGDSEGILRIFASDYGGSWAPIFASSNVRQNESERHWIVGLKNEELLVIICKGQDSYPQVNPRPVLSALKLSPMLVPSDIGASDCEKDSFLNNLFVEKSKAQLIRIAQDDSAFYRVEDTILDLEKKADIALLKNIQLACRNEKISRAYELACDLNLSKSIEGALKLSNSLRIPALSQKLKVVLEARYALLEGQQANAVGDSRPMPVRAVDDENDFDKLADEHISSPAVNLIKTNNDKRDGKASSDSDLDREANAQNSCQPNDVLKKSVKKVSAPAVSKGKVRRKPKHEKEELTEDADEAPPKKPRKQSALISSDERASGKKKTISFKPANPFARKKNQAVKAGE